MTNTQRTNAYLKKLGWDSDIVERWIPIKKHPGGGVRRDLFNFIDIIALGDDHIWGVQSCGQNFAEHDRKIRQQGHFALKWYKLGGKIMLIGWRKVVKEPRKDKRKVWKPRIKRYEMKDFLL
jgi:hypothetical protein